MEVDILMANTTDHLGQLLTKGSPIPWKGDRKDGSVKYNMLDANGNTVVHGDNGNSEHGPFGILCQNDTELIMSLINAAPALLDVVDAAKVVTLCHGGSTYSINRLSEALSKLDEVKL